MNETAAANTTCPRCGQAFRCGVDDPGPCPCTRLDLEAPALAALNRDYRGCLCLRCLEEIAAAPATPPSASG
jgi:hypothetical protein